MRIPFQVIDAHVHISIFRGNADSLVESKDLLLSDMKRFGVDYAIVIPDNTDSDPAIAGLDAASALTHDCDHLSSLGSPNVLDGGSWELQRYEQLLEQRRIHGLKFFPGHEPYYPTDSRCQPYYAACQEVGLPVVFHTGTNPGDAEVAEYNDPKFIVEIAGRYPSLKVVISHFFSPQIRYCHQVTLEAPNIYFDLDAMADEEVIQASGGIEVIREVLNLTISERPDKVVFGSDWPMCRISDHVNLVDSLGLDSMTRENILGGNAIALYKLVF